MAKTINKYELEVTFRVGANVHILAETAYDAREKLRELIEDGKFTIVEYANETIGLEIDGEYIEGIGEYEVEVEDMHTYDSDYELEESTDYCEMIDTYEYEEEEEEEDEDNN